MRGFYIFARWKRPPPRALDLCCSLLLSLAACFPAIPKRPLDVRPAPAANLPALAPCGLIHFTGEEDLSNGARGWFRGTFQITYSSFLIRHPQGVILVDAAIGNSVADDIDKAPFYFRWTLGDARAAKSITTVLKEAGVKPEEVKMVLLTHDHWDHAGGLHDLPNARIVMGAADADWILAQTDYSGRRGDAPSLHRPRRSHRSAHVQRPAHRRLRQLAGHPRRRLDHRGADARATRGATSYFINSGDGKRWLLIMETRPG